MTRNTPAGRPDTLELTELLLTRFCHDISGPVSAVSNGMELLDSTDANDEDMVAQVQELIVSSSAESFARLQTYRIAFGRINTEGDSNLDEFRDILQRYFLQGKIELEWGDGPVKILNLRINNQVRRIAANMILAVAALLPFGGVIEVSQDIDTQHRKHLQVVGSSSRVKSGEELSAIVRDKGGVEVDVKNVPWFYMAELARGHGIDITFAEEKERVLLRAVYT